MIFITLFTILAYSSNRGTKTFSHPLEDAAYLIKQSMHNYHRRQDEDLVKDEAELAIYVIDNSDSMSIRDGKIFRDNGRQEPGIISRMTEVRHIVKKIATYNMKRGMPCAFFKLNPERTGMWKENKDFIFIRPLPAQDLQSEIEEKIEILDDMCADKNIRGRTPLGKMMLYVNSVVSQLYESEERARKIIIGILADGEPNDKDLFKKQLRGLSQHNNVTVYTPIYLATEDNDVINYFNDLDRQLGIHLDVLDDYASEEREVKGKNNFVDYTMELHIVRCAGVVNKEMDDLDERTICGSEVARFIDSIKFSGEQKFEGLSTREFQRLFRQRADESEGFSKLFPDEEKVIAAYGDNGQCGRIAIYVAVGACALYQLLHSGGQTPVY